MTARTGQRTQSKMLGYFGFVLLRFFIAISLRDEFAILLRVIVSVNTKSDIFLRQ